MNVLKMVSKTMELANRHAGIIFLVGLAGVSAYQWRQWQRDKKRLAEVQLAPALPELEDWPDLPLVSVLVAAWNEAGNIERHIESFKSLRYPHKELVLCAGGTDGTYDIATQYAGDGIIVLEQQTGEGKQKALRRSFDRTYGEVIFLTDADCLLMDEPFERTLWPVASGVELVATGSSQPFDEQLNNPFVFTQAAIQVYGALHASDYAPGILGRNCVVQRELLARTAALDVPAPTGTDYVLAKVLDSTGTAIRQVPHSRMPTEYPTTVKRYLRQQRRWLRNVIIHGRRFGADAEVHATLRTSLLGLAMLLMPLPGLLAAPWLLALWNVLVGQALMARLRYLAFAGTLLNRPTRVLDALWQGPYLLLDFFAWTQPLADIYQRDRWRW